MITNTELMTRGMECLVQNLGDLEAQRFISTIMREKFDYTQWRREHFGNMDADAFLDAAVAYATEHPYQLKSQNAGG